MKVQRIDHVGVIVNDLPFVKAFFLELGLRELGETEVKGKWVEQIIDLNDVKETVVMLEVPDGEAMIELVKFHFPTDDKGIQQNLPNTLGLRHIAFAVKDIEGIVAPLKKRGGELIGQVQNYEDIYKLCYIRGPEGIILELAEKIG
ncbi:VOC family protein [Tetragenococcus koreensis]|uniref:Glyoxalase n=1 Tax=Tetragenococcus koreensis TaxID=290335 RepID=A0AAN4UA94_9ENTE|nr:VOC family protein [Tetragenococcus koreensis]AYW45848.1 glyoxalase [Tetragenococcus koreensis]MCF1585136.1 VOC family protein [Tetragenococcus koreensis]MCF1614720.1 VOC family protein [Tetragenococcus koreensis]MCF1624524.1 VOC family protein [Tetragenococcus koreensis]MCF1629457.1 VOC family protein [Tetragenococcus koreensis]